jgi:hypothetical protein
MMYKFVEKRSMGFASGNLAAISLFCQDCGIERGAANMSWQLVDSIWPTPFSTLSSCETDEFFRKLIGYFVDTDENPTCTVCGEIIETEG